MPISSSIGIFGGLALFTAGLIAANYWRSRRHTHFSLTPNCLITRFPLVFISGQRSPFYFLSYWNEIPHYLHEHGYVIEEWSLPWRNSEARLAALQSHLKVAKDQAEKPTPAHLILQSDDWKAWRNFLAEQDWAQLGIASITVVGDESLTLPSQENLYSLCLKDPMQPSFSRWISSIIMFCHRLWTGLQPGNSALTLALPGFANSQVYQQILQQSVKIAEDDLRFR